MRARSTETRLGTDRVIEIINLERALGESTDMKFAAVHRALGDLLAERRLLVRQMQEAITPPELPQACPLSENEAMALTYAAHGHNIETQAQITGMNLHTVRTRRRTAARKLAANSEAHAVTICSARGWIRLSEMAPAGGTS